MADADAGGTHGLGKADRSEIEPSKRLNVSDCAQLAISISGVAMSASTSECSGDLVRRSIQAHQDAIATPVEARSPNRLGARRADIDGLRALAVMAVILYHLDIPHVRGGFVGVDIFFVISGFVIAANIEAEFVAGTFSISRFFERRLRRLLPPAVTVAVVATAAATFLLPPFFYVGFVKSLMAMVLSTSNIWFRSLGGDGYFDPSMGEQLLLHTWSLSIEEQFYLLLPVIYLCLRPFSKRWFAVALAVVAALSLWRAAALVGGDAPRVFYLLPYRAWELLIGVLLALGWRPSLARRWLREAMAALGCAMIFYAVLSFNRATVFPGAAALIPCLGSYLVICAGSDGETFVGTVLSRGPVVFIGLISYSLYLWHWPIIVTADLLQCASVPVVLGSTFICAVLSWRFVETPFRQRRVLASRTALFTAVSACVASLLGFGIVVTMADGLPSRFDPATATRIAANMSRGAQRSNYSCLNYKAALSSAAEMHQCTIPGTVTRKVLFWGDSHVAQFRPLVEDLAKSRVFGGRSIVFATSGGCAPTPEVNRAGYHCESFSRLAEGMAANSDVDAVFLGFSGWYEASWTTACRAGPDDTCVAPIGGRQVAMSIADEVRRLGRDLARRGARLVVMLPIPIYDMQIPELESRVAILEHWGLNGRAAALRSRLARSDFFMSRALVKAAADEVGASLFDPRAALCDGEDCRYAVDGIAIYSDFGHLAGSQVGMFSQSLQAAFAPIFPRGTSLSEVSLP